MSADSPPTYYFTGIQFNSSFYADVSTAPLTQSQASALYLLKNSADTATALETFTGGILTNNISPVTTSLTISLNSSKTATTNADPAIAIATSDLTRTIKLGNESATNQNSIHLASLDVTYNNLNNITGTTGVVQIGNKQTTLAGVLNLGCSTAGNVRVDAPINIGTDTTMTGIITIGSSSATQSIIIKNAHITMGTGKNITLQPTTSYVGPVAGQLGFTNNATGNTTPTLNTNTNIASQAVTTAGVYIVTGTFTIPSNATAITNIMWLNTTSISQTGAKGLIKYLGAISTEQIYSVVAVFNTTVASTFYLSMSRNTATGIVSGTLSATRIA
jgi:hypothetical protein